MVTGPEISVIIPAYQAEDTIDRCLDALAHQTVPRARYEVLVVDDDSTDGTRIRVQAHGGVRLLRQEHRGPAAARNLGVDHALGEIVLFTDADCEPLPDWIERMAAALDGGAVAAKGAYLTRQRELVARFVQVEYEDKYDHMAREPEIDFVDTYAAGYRRDVFLAHGGFETVFPVASVEDQEFSFRLARRGYRMVFVPEARVYHWGHAQDVWSYGRKKFRIGYWKVMVHRRHPDKLWRDSHTPQVLKAQILLAGLATLGLVAGLAWPALWWASGVLALLFLLTTVPFVRKAWRKDVQVSLVSPGLLLVRALALGTGFAAGLVANLGPRDPWGD
jgi:glycosyltransferase involved in cell wall biosynthesis